MAIAVPLLGAWRRSKKNTSLGSKSGSGRWSHWDEIGWVHYPEILHSTARSRFLLLLHWVQALLEFAADLIVHLATKARSVTTRGRAGRPLCTNRPSAFELIMSISEQVVRFVRVPRAHLEIDGHLRGPVDEVMTRCLCLSETQRNRPGAIQSRCHLR